jgi:hypothetical protein
MNRPELYKLIELCRPGSDDLCDPDQAELARQVQADAEIRARYEAVQKLDGAIGTAFHDVPVPAGLEQRLLAGVAARVRDKASDTPANPSQNERSATSAAELEAAPRRKKRFLRRRMRWIGVGGVAAALLIAVAAWAIVKMYPAPKVPLETLAHRALRWVDQLLTQPWKSLDENGPEGLVPGYPLEPSLRAGPLRFQQFGDERDTVVAYDLAAPGQPIAAQFTIRTSREYDVPGVMMSKPLWSSGPYCIGACQRDGVLYVLVVEGDAGRFRQFVQPRLPIT